MTKEKLSQDIVTLHRFVQNYCDQKHEQCSKNSSILAVNFENEKIIDISYSLCQECTTTFLYAYDRLQNCPLEPKPSCRKCPKPCYEKPMWKKVAHIMMYSGMHLGFTKIRRLFKK